MLNQFYPQTSHKCTYELNKDFNFAAAHYIPHKDAGKCANVHGHQYVCNLTVVGNELDDSGFLVNFSELKKLVHDRYDHTLLNDHSEYQPLTFTRFPTTEEVAAYICRIVNEHLTNKPNKPHCIQVILKETPSSYVVYRPTIKGVTTL